MQAAQRLRFLCRASFWFGLLIPVLAIFLYALQVPFFEILELKTFDLRLQFRGHRDPGPEVAIAAIDERSLNTLGRWPWPRSVLAELVDKLSAGRPRVIAFDVVFAEPDKNSELAVVQSFKDRYVDLQLDRLSPASSAFLGELARAEEQADQDARLTQAIQKAGQVVLGMFFLFSPQEAAHITPEQLETVEDLLLGQEYAQVISIAPSRGPIPVPTAYGGVANIPPLTRAARHQGYFNQVPDADGSIRRAPLVVRFGDWFYPSLDIQILKQYYGTNQVALRIKKYGVDSIVIGDTFIPTDEAGKFYINYTGGVETFSHYSVIDILNGTIPPETFADRIVLVGPTAVGISDLWVTPVSPVLPGVQVHANILENVIRGKFLLKSNWMILTDLIIILGLGWVLAVALTRLGPIRGLACSLLVVAAYIVGNYLVFREGIWLNMVYPLMTTAMSNLTITTYRYFTEEMEKKKVRQAFQSYLDPNVVDAVTQDPSRLKLGGQRQVLTVMFSDVRGFTSMSEGLDPEALVKLLNIYLSKMTEIVFKYGGTLDKYIGDAIMGVWGAPLAQLDHAERACRAALEMVAALDDVRDVWDKLGGPPLSIGIGINTGPMVVGNIGSERRFDYTVIGDSVNLAARLEGTNKEYGTSIIISEDTYAAVKDLFLCRELDRIQVKGKYQPITIYDLLGPLDAAAEWKEFSERFQAGLQSYRSQRWSEAIAEFDKALILRPQDAPSELYIRRCVELRDEPPVLDWDGVFVMKTK